MTSTIGYAPTKPAFEQVSAKVLALGARTNHILCRLGDQP